MENDEIQNARKLIKMFEARANISELEKAMHEMDFKCDDEKSGGNQGEFKIACKTLPRCLDLKVGSWTLLNTCRHPVGISGHLMGVDVGSDASILHQSLCMRASGRGCAGAWLGKNGL